MTAICCRAMRRPTVCWPRRTTQKKARTDSIPIRGPRIIAVTCNCGHLWGEQHRIETRTKRNHWRGNSGGLTISGKFWSPPLVSCWGLFFLLIKKTETGVAPKNLAVGLCQKWVDSFEKALREPLE